jgi:hypothetical protein
VTHAKSTPTPAPTAHRIAPAERATVALQDLDDHDSILILTFGQFSIGDAIRALLDRTGPAHVTIATWTAAAAENERAWDLIQDRRITGMRWVVDRSFATRQPAYCRALVDRFGVDAVRATRTHAKFVVIDPVDGPPVTVITSCNLNNNPRLETIHVIRGEQTAAWFRQIVADIWATSPAGDLGFGDLPVVAAPERAVGVGRVATGVAPAVGRVSPGR